MKVRRYSDKERKEIKAWLNEMLALGFIFTSHSPYRTNLVMAPRAGGSQRICIDYTTVNPTTEKDAYPIPHINDILHFLRGAQWIPALDLKNEFHDITVHSEDRHFTAFVTPFGHFEWIRMPFDLTNAPAGFQRCMAHLFAEMLWNEVTAYLDDITVKSLGTPEAHIAILNKICQILRKANLPFKEKNCVILATIIKLSGSVVSGTEISPDDSKFEIKDP